MLITRAARMHGGGDPMRRTSLHLGYAAAAGSAALLGAAYLYQLAGYAPCTMCIWQRYPHGVAIALGLALLVLGRGRVLLAFGALAAGTTAALGLYHTGVERGWWEGPSACTGGASDLSAMTGADLLSFDTTETLVLCDEVVWEFLSLSMASWNAILSALLAGVWIAALVLSRRTGRA
ncbi:disulfide bond formation protein B [uncultured Jannaschia sp.]|uniref:disulfide bond formation protein B n=1 Tax=uncultured Jannaschia sp. TaxID=293347 RepID=UPI00345BC54C